MTNDAAKIRQWVDQAVQAARIVDMHTHLFPPSFESLQISGADRVLIYHYLIAEAFRMRPSTSEWSEALRSSLARWPAREAEVIRARFGLDGDGPAELSSVMARFEVSRDQIQQWERKALAAMPRTDRVQELAAFWPKTPAAQADWIYERLFVGHSPLSEAAAGVVDIARAFGVDLQREGLPGLRRQLSATASEEYMERVLAMAGVDQVVMTNDPLDPVERQYWERQTSPGSRFAAALRLDSLLNQYDQAVGSLQALGYRVEFDLSRDALAEVRRFLEEWTDRMDPVYFAASLPDTFDFPDGSPRSRLLESVVLPLARERGLPLALMIGARRQVNPGLRSAGDSSGKAAMGALEYLCREFPSNKFLVSLLSRESQHELIVTARKFGNLMPFGCWWFLNTESLVEEITRMRLELIGTSFIAQHSDARVLEHVVYKWALSRRVIARVLTDRYLGLAAKGWQVTEPAIQADVRDLFSRNFWEFVRR